MRPTFDKKMYAEALREEGREEVQEKYEKLSNKEVVETAQRMGYQVNSIAQTLSRKDITLGIIMPAKWQQYFAGMKEGMEQEIRHLQKYGGIITIEEHNLSGGLGSAVAEVICGEELTPEVFKRLALPDVNVSLIGHQEWIREEYGMSAEGIAETIRKACKK